MQERAKKAGLEHPFTDYVNTKADPAGTRVIMSLLPAGNIKISNDVGIRRIPQFTETDTYVELYAAIADLYTEDKVPAVEEVIGAVRGAYEEVEYPPFDVIQRGIYDVFAKNPRPTRKELSDAIVRTYNGSYNVTSIVKSIASAFKAAGLTFQGEPKVYSEALLPPFGEEFKTTFIQNATTLINKATLITRLTGLVSFYKGSSLELMPRVKSDEVVRVPFGDYAQKAYSAKRGVELKKELEATPGQKIDDVWNKVYDMADDSASSNFMMSSRQLCNFAFPPEVARPAPKTKKEEKTEAAAGMIVGELVTLPADSIEDEKKVEEEFPELKEDEEEIAEAEEAEAEARAEEEAEEEAEMPALVGGAKTIAEMRAEKLAAKSTAIAVAVAPAAMNCKAPQGEYTEACVEAKKCLATVARARMTLGGEDGLKNYSGKFAVMLEKIAAAPGSSLVYSQLLNMEGIGIFRVAMDVNGYAPIEVIEEGGTIKFSPETEASFAKKQPRYITFSGGEDERVRAAALSIFNAQFSDLPESMNAILKKAGYTDNKVGEICRVFCITSAGAEGLSLRNVRAVHIMEPYWNDVRLTQVKGRAVRIGSHLDLPENQRDVSIYTYISVFSDDAQSNKVPERRIDQTLLIHDSVDASVAKDVGIPIKPGTTTYVLTTDEIFYGISERKRKIIEALQCILKSASVDCEINLKKNKDESFMCLPLKGRVGDFLYNPILKDDILEAPQFQGADGKDILDTVCVTGVKPRVSSVVALPDIFKALKGITYRMRPVTNEAGDIIRFDMYEADQADPKKKIPEKLLGTAGVKDGNPAGPVKLL